MALDWSQCPAVESVPGKVSGAWVFRGTRMPVSIVFENLEDGMTIDRTDGTVSCYARTGQGRSEFATRSLDPPLWLIARCLYCWIRHRRGITRSLTNTVKEDQGPRLGRIVQRREIVDCG